MLPDWTEDDLTVDGARLHYYRLGDRTHPPLVLVHGFSDNGLCWLTLAGDLQAEYDIVLPDARGHGRSARVGQDGGRVDLTADLAGVIRGLGLERPIVAGHSMGAMTAAQLAARFFLHLDLLFLDAHPDNGKPLRGQCSITPSLYHKTRWNS